MSEYASLPAITALARAGAVERAWSLFTGSGHAAKERDPASLAVKGRLLKSKARLCAAGEREALFLQAAQVYAQASEIAPAPYLAINAATLHLLAGDPPQAAREAQGVLAMLDAAEVPADTPYYLAATRAEALLLQGRRAEAEQALEEAIGFDPDGWSDHAVTLSQLEEICTAQLIDHHWLDRFRPPASLHFAGHMGVAIDGASERAVAAAIDALMTRQRIGFGYGALAAGADIVVAEHLVAAGAELHVVLPSSPDCFERQSVAPAGDDWKARFRALLDRADTIKAVTDTQTGVHDALATRLAGEMAIGAALLNARRLGAKALQLALVDESGGGSNTARQVRIWPAAKRQEQAVITVPRDARVEALFPPEAPDPARRLAVQIAIRLTDRSGASGIPLGSQAIAHRCEPVWRVLKSLPPSNVRAGALRWDVLVTDLAQAIEVILALAAIRDLSGAPVVAIAAHYGIVTCVTDPSSGQLVPHGPGTEISGRLLGLSVGGMATISEDLAVALTTCGIGGVRSEFYQERDPALGGAIYTLLRVAQ